MGGVRKLQFLLIYSTIYANVRWLGGPKKSQKHADVILEWSLTVVGYLCTISFPYNSFIFTNETKNILMPLIFNINQDSQWPDSVKDTARKYSQFQDNKYPQIIRETALSAILNGEDNVVLDHLYNLAPEPLISFGDFPITKTKDRIAEENRFTDEVSKAELELKRALYRDAAEEFQQEINFF